MRILVVLKSGRYYTCTSMVSKTEDDEIYRMTRGGSVSIPRSNIDSVETYATDSAIEYGLRPRLRSLEENDKFQEM